MNGVPIALSLIWLAAEAPLPVPVPPWVSPVLNGFIGAGVILWFMWRDKEWIRLQRENTKALNLGTRAMMVLVLSLRHLDGATKEVAAQIKDEADTAIVTAAPKD